MRRVGIALLLLVLALLGVVLVAREVGPSSFDDGTDETQTPEAVDATSLAPGGNRPTVRASGSPADDDLDAATSIRGTVRDAKGEPIVGARVSLHAAHPTRRVEGGVHLADFERTLTETTSRWDGTFALPAEASAALVVVVSKEGHVPAARRAAAGADCAVTLYAAETVLVRFVDVAGTPIEGATVYARAAGRDGTEVPSPLTTSGPDGRASVPSARDGEFVVRARGYATTEFSRDSIAEEEDVRTIVLDDGSVLAGVVVDGAGTPVREAVVFAGEDGHEFDSVEHRTVTDGDGAFRLEGISPRGLVHLRARHPDRGAKSQRVFPGETDIRFVLRRPGRVRGVVVHDDGSPAGGAQFPWDDATCGPDGDFEVRAAGPGPTKIVAIWPHRPATHTGSTLVEVPDGGTVEGVRIVLTPERRHSRLPVRVVDAEGEPVPGVNVETYLAAQCIGVDLATESTDTLDLPVPPGTQVRVFAGDTRRYGHGAPAASAEAVTVPRGDAPAEPVVLRLGPPGRLTIRLLDPEGRDVPLSRARLDFDGRMPEGPADGAWPLHPAEALVLHVEVPGFARRRVAVDPPHPPELELKVRLVPATRVIGRVVDAEGRPPALMTKVRISMPGDGDDQAAEEYTLPDGRFEIDAPSGDAVELAVLDRERMRRLRRPVRIQGTGTLDLGNVALPRMAAVEGFVTDERGRGIGGARVRFLDAGDDWRSPDATSMVVTGPDGRFRVSLPQRDGIRVEALRTGYGAASTSIAPAGPRPVRIVLRPGGRVRVRFSAGPALVHARVVGTEEWWFALPVFDSLDDPDEDEIVFDGFPPGEVELSTWHLGVVRTTRVIVVAGETVEARF